MESASRVRIVEVEGEKGLFIPFAPFKTVNKDGKAVTVLTTSGSKWTLGVCETPRGDIVHATWHVVLKQRPVSTAGKNVEGLSLGELGL